MKYLIALGVGLIIMAGITSLTLGLAWIIGLVKAGHVPSVGWGLIAVISLGVAYVLGYVALDD